MITIEMLKAIAPHVNPKFSAALVDALNKHLPAYGIDSLLRMAHFLGQAAEETDGFKTLEEYASGRAYEGRTDLGNTHPGDGMKFKGRGIFQLTGRANYKRIGDILSMDLVAAPELAENPDIAVQTACEYWKTRHLEKYADADDIIGMTKHINGGTLGLVDRKIYTSRAKHAFAPLFEKH